MTVYVINDSLSRLLYRGLRLSKLVTCAKGSDKHSLICRHVDSSNGIIVELVDKWNIKIIIDSKYVVTGDSYYYKIIGGAGKTLFYALKTLTEIPMRRSLGYGLANNVEVIDYGDMIIIVLEDVIAVIGRGNYVSISDLFMSREDELLFEGNKEFRKSVQNA